MLATCRADVAAFHSCCSCAPTIASSHLHKLLCISSDRVHATAASCPAAAGLNGLVDAVEPGLACGSDTSHMNLLGYDPRR